MKTAIPNYDLLETLGEGLHSAVYKGFHKKNPGRPLAIKILKAASLSEGQKAYFLQKIEHLKILRDNHLILPLSYREKGDVRFITQDYFEGVTLDKWAGTGSRGRIGLDVFFAVACKLAELLDKVHRAGIIHGGVKPHNILIRPENRDIRLIDFITPFDVRDVSHFIYDRSFIEGTLAYTSPEQTGRINHRVDFTTDLYSLGIVLYELLTGRPPFFSTDPLELIHSHLAEEVPPAHELNPEIPPVLSKIIAKLTAKQPEKRYQSGAGLLADLMLCRDRCPAAQTVQDFALGRYDRAHRVIFISKMVGRDREAELILDEYGKAARGSFRCLLISGLPGIGKTRLIQELQKPIVEHRGYFTSGKFDIYQKNIPYSSLIQALKNLVRTLLTESDSRVGSWKEIIIRALGENGGVITNVIPELAALIGPQPEVKTLPPVESRNRFHDLFARFLTCLASKDHPLTIFIDDLQWCDNASFDFLSNIFANHKEHPYLFLIGAYRYNEVDSTHPLTKLVQSITEGALPMREIRLEPLNAVHCHEMVSYVLGSPLEQTAALSGFIADLTEGNPLFVSESLSYLHNEDLLFLDEKHCWQWDLDRIRSSDMPSTVAALFSSKVQRLPAETIEILEFCACMGNRFAPDELASVRGISLLHTFASLMSALGQGLLMESKNNLQFVHDRVQEAVLNAINRERRRQIHWQIGNHLLSRIPGGTDLRGLDNLFTVASHLNLGKGGFLDREAACRLSDINFHAGSKAMDSFAVEAANEYFRQSMELLPDDCWDALYDRTFKIFLKLAKSELMCGRYERSESLLNQLLDHARTDLDKAEALAEQTTSLSSIGNFRKAIETANRGLSFFGKSIPDNPEDAERKREQLMDEINSGHADIRNTILNMPFTTERKSKIELAFYSELIPDLYMSGLVPQLYLSAVQSTRHCLAGGMDESVIYSFSIMGLYLGEQGEFEQAFRYEDLARDLSEKYPNTFGATRGMNGVVWCNMHSRSHPEEIVNYCLRSIRCGKNCGDLYNAGLSYGPLMWNLQVQGSDISAIEEYAGECLRFSQKYHLSFSAGLAEAMHAGWIMPMKRENRDSSHFSFSKMGAVPVFSMEEKIMQWKRDDHIASAGSYCVLTALVHYYFGEYEKAETSLQEVKRYLAGLTDNVLKRQWYVFRVLNALRLHDKGTMYRGREELESYIQPIIRKVETWAGLGPLLRPYLAFIHAEREMVTGEPGKARGLYLDAIAVANEQRYTLLEAHLCECLGELLERSGQGTARLFFAEAGRLYRKCGAERKEVFLMERRPEYFEEENSLYVQNGKELNAHYTLPPLDFDYLMKLSLAIAAEIDPNALLKKIMNVVLEASGAQHGYLLIEEEEQLFICAESHVAEKDAVRTVKYSLESAGEIPKTIVRYVHRTREKIILCNASGEGEFSADPDMRKIERKSVLCLPVINQSRLVGILYLENRLAESVFTEGKARMLELLTSQAAISLENARLVEEMKKAEESLKNHSDHLEEMVEERTRKLNEARQELIMAEKHIGLGRLAGGIAHEIKNQLTPILMEAQRIIGQIEDRKDISTGYILERIKTVEEASRTANKITMALLDYARESRPEFSRYSLRESLDGIMALYHPERRRTSVRMSLEEVEVEEIYADRRQLEQVLVNVINNAFEAISAKGEGGAIAVSVKKEIPFRRETPFVVISITDTGIGIPPENQSKIFDPFFTTKAPAGAGLGLSVSYGIVERHNGRIELYSRPGEGSTFRIYLPLKEE